MSTRRWCWSLLVALVLVPGLLPAQPVQVWLNQYGTQSHTAYQMIRTSSGQYAHCVREGYSGDALFLLDSAGEEIWHHTYGEMGNYDSNEDVLEMPDGGFLLAGYAWIDAQAAYDARLIRTDASGAVIWETFAGSVEETDYGHKVVRTEAGRIFMTGQIWTGSVSEGALWEFNDNGDLLNTYNYNAGTSSVGFHTIILTSDDHLVMSGGGYFNVDDYDGWAIKVDMDGEIVWSNVLYNDNWQYMSRIGEAADGSFIFAGNGVSEPDGDPHPWYGRLDADGNVQYTTYYGNPTASSYFLECAPDVDGNWLLAGRYEGADPDQDALLLKINPADGSLIWTLTVGESDPGSDEGFSDIVLDPDGSYILAGDGDFNALTHPGFIAMYNMTGSGVEPVAMTNQPRAFSLVNVYPNPFNATTTVVLELAQPCELQVDVVNVNGQVVSTLTHASMAPGTHRLNWRADSFASGVYWLRASVPGSLTATRKITLVK